MGRRLPISGLQELVSSDSSPGQCGSSIFWPEPTTADDCGVASIQSSAPAGSFFSVGESVVIYTAIDVHGNSTSAEMLVVVSDVEPPQVINLPGPIVTNPDPATSSAPYRIYNIGNNNPVMLMDYIEALETSLGKKAEKELLPL